MLTALLNRSKEHAFWLVLIVLLVLTALIHLPVTQIGFNPGSTSHIDAIWLIYSSLKNLSSSEGYARMEGYPPLMLGIYEFSRIIVTQASSNTGASHSIEVLDMARLINAFANIGAVGLIALTGKRLLNGWVGFLAAPIWIASPILHGELSTGLTESWQAFFIILALYLSVLALDEQSARFAIFSIIAGLFAVLAKYPAFPALGFGTGVVLWLCITDDRRRWGRVLALQIVLIVGFAVWLLFGYGAIQAFQNAEGAEFVTGELSRHRNWSSLVGLFEIVAEHIGLSLGFFAGLGLLGTILVWRSEAPSKRLMMIYMWIFSLIHTSMVTLYLVKWEIASRYVVPTSAVNVLFVAVAIERMIDFFAQRLISDDKRRLVLKGSGLLLVVGIWLAPNYVNVVKRVSDTGLPRNELRFVRWVDQALGEGTIRIFDDWTWIYFDGDWGGYLSEIRPWINDPLLSKTPEEWVANYVYYAEITEHERAEMLATETGSDYLDDLVLLKTFPTDDGWSGEAIYVYDLRGIEERRDELFGDTIQLVGQNLNAEQIRPGESLRVQFFWNALQTPPENYQVFLHLVPEDSLDVLAQADGMPATESYPTTAWQEPQEVISGRVFELTIPDDLPEGQYRLIMGLYELNTFVRLTTATGMDHVVIGQVEITD